MIEVPDKVLICGSRKVNIKLGDIDSVFKENNVHPGLIISGGAIGPDTRATEWARHRDVLYAEHLPDWHQFGNYAGLKRNKEMVDECDVCVAFWDGQSKGTKFTIDYAKEQGKRTIVVDKS